MIRRIISSERCLRQRSVLIFKVLVLRSASKCSMIVEALVKIEVVQVVSYSTIVESCTWHSFGNATTIVGCIVGLAVWIVAVDHLNAFVT